MAGKSVPKVKQKLDKKDLTLSLAFLLPAILITVIFFYKEVQFERRIKTRTY